MTKEAIIQRLLNGQMDLHGKIARALENLQKLGKDNITLEAVETRLECLEVNWAKFDAQHDQLLAYVDAIPEHNYLKQDVPGLAQEAYLTQKSVFRELINSLRPKEPAPQPVAGGTGLRNGPKSTLPRIQLPQFSGRYEDWPTFRDLFKSIIDRPDSISPVEKLHYLKTCVKGEAELLIRNLATTEENYGPAWEALKKYYENKRLLVRAYLTNFLALPRMKAESSVELRKIFHQVKATNSSLEGIGRAIGDTEDLFVHLIVELLDPRSRREWEHSICDDTEPPSYDVLEEFLERRLHMLEAMAPTRSDGSASKSGNGNTKSTRSHLTRKQDGTTADKRGRCPACQKDHFVMFCEDYKKKTAQERKQLVEGSSICRNCLGNHKLNDCISKKSCTVCNARHHTSLHDAYREVGSSTTTHVTQRSPVKQVGVLLATARVRVADKHGTLHSVRALIDQGSESSLVSERVAQLLKLPRKATAVTVFGLGGLKTGVAKGKISMKLTPRIGGQPLEVSALILPRLTSFASSRNSASKGWPHVSGLELADPDFQAADAIDLILGAEVYAVILKEGLRKGNAWEPVAQNTALGWILSGHVEDATTVNLAHTYQCQIGEDLNESVRRFWEQEECPSSKVALSKDEQECEEHFQRTHSRDLAGRYVVRLPIVEPLPNLSATRGAAVRCLKHMENKFVREPEFFKLYAEFMRQYSDLGHMTQVLPATKDRSRLCYLPHHGVMRAASSSTKLRVVFNGSSRLPSGTTLNRHLQTGPNLLPGLADILLKWRRHRFVFATDIEKMYRQIDVHAQDRDLQRILWRENPGEEIREFQLNTVTYGLACAPFLAIRTLHQLARDEEAKAPLGAAILHSDVYMDDVLSGAATITEAKTIQTQLIRICTAGGFPLKKWSANDAALVADLPAEDRLQQDLRWWLPGESHTTLGLRWHPHEDCFSYTTVAHQMEVVTKRSVLSLTAKLFDPLGWLSPVTVRAKIRIQATWLLGVDWDTILPDADIRRWREFEAELPQLETIRIPRWLRSSPSIIQTEIHGFSDASERAYGAVIYLRTKDQGGKVVVRLMIAKTKVSPLKQITLPRLELCAAVLLTRLSAYTQAILETEANHIHLWTDSTVTLGWIRGHPAAWKTYVANRVSEIQTTLPNAHWHHVPGKENPADHASRGLSPKELVDSQLWWHGPTWLQSDEEPWSTAECDEIDAVLPDRRPPIQVHIVTKDEVREPEMLRKYSELQKLIRTTAWCRRWLRKQKDAEASHLLLADELDAARTCWIRVVQARNFQNELEALEKDKDLPTRSTLLKLSPFLDAHGILRVGGRLRHSHLDNDAKHPIILPKRSHLTQLIVEAHHRRMLHGGVQLTLGALRREFWIPCGRTIVKSCIHRCLTCVRWRAVSPQPLMGDLPAPRVTPARPFLNTGVDYAGPIWLRTSPGRGHRASKAFIVVFVCLASRAIHLDAVSDYSAEAFLAALRRFTSRRGLCHALYSDCGTTFVGADTQLRELFAASSREGRRIAALVSEERIRWHFNPPAAPNFGGLWEAAVKSMKHHLRRVIGDAKLTYEEMATLLSQIEACLNSRPLQALSDDPEDLDALTPGHFLIGTAITAVPAPSLTEEPTTRLSRWRTLQRMRDHFWSRWSKEYLHTLAHRPKWCRANVDIRVGRLCLLRNEATPPTKWPLARIEKLHPGQDGHVRVVDVRTATSSFTRPVNKVVLLPLSDTPGGPPRDENN